MLDHLPTVISDIWPFLIAAFFMGLVVGWMAQDTIRG